MKNLLPAVILLCLLTVLLAGGCRARGDGSPAAVRELSARGDGSPAAGAEPHQILGTSDRLTEKEWLSMRQWREEMVLVARRHPGEIFLNGRAEQEAVCLTFDDGPDGVFTPKVLDILRQYGVHASFFFTGMNVKSFPSVARLADRDGNLVLNHTWDHADLSILGETAIRGEIDRAGDEIAAAIGKRPAIVRPPYGAVNEQVISSIGKSNCKIIIWSIDTLDWSQKEKENIARNVLGSVRPGDIILMHSNADRQATVDALPEIITGLQARGYQLLTLSQMLGIPAYQ